MPQAPAALKKGVLPAASAKSPECEASWLSWLLFLWIGPFAKEAYQAVQEKRFSGEMMPPVPEFERPETNTEILSRMWAEERRTRGPKANLVWVTFKFMRRALIMSFFITNLQAFLMLGGAFCTYMLVEAIQGLQPAWYGYLMCFLLTFITAVCAVLMQLSWHLSCRSARQYWQAISGTIFAKPAYLSSTSRAHLPEGAIVNIMSVDAPQILHYMQYWAIFAATPMYIIVPSIVLPILLGWSYAVGLLITIFAAVISDHVAKKVRTCQGAKLKAADMRNGKLNECFQGIRTVKLNAWETLMEDRVAGPRQEELRQLRWFHLYNALQIALSIGLPVVAVLMTFVLYVLQGGELEPARVFACVALFEFTAQGCQNLPHIFNVARQLKNNIDRMQELLILEDDYERAGANNLPPGTASCQNADFRWNAKDLLAEATLRDVSLEAAPGELVAVCGRVGAGKTTFAAGLLGLVSKSKGSIAISGRTAYVTQVPQILNTSIKDNILFGADMDRSWYNKVLKACCLIEDLKQWDAGDETEIGERGITISGGQKQRIAIARAAYSRADILVFDDPLSAMDAHVGKQVFDMVFRGILSNSTRIFFTNQLHFCRACHKVYMLDLGVVVEAGTYRELVGKSPLGPFGSFVQSVLGGSSGEEEDNLDFEDVKIELEDTPDDNVEEDTSTSADSGDARRKDVNDKDKQVVSTATTATPTTSYSVYGNGNITPAMTKQATTGTLMSVEKKAVGRIGLKTWFDIVTSAEALPFGMYVGASCIAASLFQYACTFFLGFWTDSLLSADRKQMANDPFEDLTPVILYLAVGVIFVASLALRGHSVAMFFLKASKVLHAKMLASTLRQRMTWFDTTPVGRVLNRFGNDVQNMDLTLTMVFPMWAQVCGKVVLMIFMSGVTAYPALIFCLFLLGISQKVYALYGAVALDIQRCQMMSLSPLVGAFSSFLTALDSIRCFDRVDIFVSRFTEHQNNFIKCFYWGFSLDRGVQCLFTSCIIATFVAIISLLMLTLSIYEVPVLSVLITPGTAGTVLSLNTSLAFFAPVAIYVSMRLETTSACMQRIAEFGAASHEDDDVTGKELPPPSWPTQGEVVLDNVEMRYQPHLPLALRGVSLRVKPGERVGIVGRTGSGKSTLILTCFRMVECQAGSIMMDGKDITTMPVQELRGRLGVIPQDSWLFSGTIRSNIDPYGKHSTEELWRVLQHVHLDRVAKTQAWLDTEVKEKGENLSSGTAQLLCLARVLLKRPQILFMDEATASVDSETDNLIQETIRREGVLPSGCSVITIAHRLHTVIDYDKIIVMSKGQVVEEGNPAALLDKEDGHLSQLVRDTGEASAKELRRRCGPGDLLEDMPNEAMMLAGVPIISGFGSCGPEMAEISTSQAPGGRPRGRCMPLPLFC